MAQIGKFIYRKFHNQYIEFITEMNSEWIEYSDHTAINDAILSGKVLDYDEESGVLTFAALETNQVFYISEESIEIFWETGRFDLIKNSNNILKTGRKYIKKDRDIM